MTLPVLRHIHIHIHTLDPEQFRPATQAVNRLAEAMAAVVTAMTLPETIPMAAPEMPAREPDEPLDTWTFHSPRHGGTVTAYVDPQNQVRHVLDTRVSEVPKTWRLIRLDPPRN